MQAQCADSTLFETCYDEIQISELVFASSHSHKHDAKRVACAQKLIACHFPCFGEIRSRKQICN